MEDFYLTLPSSVKNPQFENTSSRYVTRLPQVLQLERDRFVVAVTDIIYPYSFVNVGRPLKYWVHFKNAEPVQVEFPSAQYSDISQIVECLNFENSPRRPKRSAPTEMDPDFVAAKRGFDRVKRDEKSPEQLVIDKFTSLKKQKTEYEIGENKRKQAELDKIKGVHHQANQANIKNIESGNETIEKFKSLKDQAVEAQRLQEAKAEQERLEQEAKAEQERLEREKQEEERRQEEERQKEEKRRQDEQSQEDARKENERQQGVLDQHARVRQEAEEHARRQEEERRQEEQRRQEEERRRQEEERRQEEQRRQEEIDRHTRIRQEAEEHARRQEEERRQEEQRRQEEIDRREKDERERREKEENDRRDEDQRTGQNAIDKVKNVQQQSLDRFKNLKNEQSEHGKGVIQKFHDLAEEERDHANFISDYFAAASLVYERPTDRNEYIDAKQNLERLRLKIASRHVENVDHMLHFIERDGRIHVDLLDAEILFVEFEPSCAYFLGFHDTIVRDSGTAPSKVDMFGNVSTIYLYCDIVDPIIVGDQKNQLLSVIPCRGKYGEMIHHTIPHPRYLPIMNNTVDSIKVEFLSEFAEPINFNWGSTIIVLHFKKI
ncbi:hypothetical protein CAEBREN_31771 [Caenorhabditis brenneri]|uniref:Uncharacterized protein n=1 Tax=Caenorhabditis brenneri TaxID=135651 RepID=G0MSM9_CAEBE|nr:hypothetical protein CAEBREN_31771 [Caenorhabditis brenneri]